MKTRKFFMLLVVSFIITLAGCASAHVDCYDTGITNDVIYPDYEKWEEENQIRLILDIEIAQQEVESGDISGIGDLDLPEKKMKDVKRLQEGIISFFLERYNIDVSKKLEMQEIAIFKATGNQEGVMGYVDVTIPHILNLNEKLLNEEMEKFETTYIHETLHQIGFRSKNALMLEEGITDALTDMISCFLKVEPVLTIYYSESRTLAYQMLKADPEIVSCYLEDNGFDIIERINEKLSNIPHIFEKEENIGQLLEMRIKLLYSIATGMAFGYSTDPYWFAYEAQEIVTAYCKECEPDTSTIDYIRNHYLVTDYENIVIFEDENGYGYYLE